MFLTSIFDVLNYISNIYVDIVVLLLDINSMHCVRMKMKMNAEKDIYWLVTDPVLRIRIYYAFHRSRLLFWMRTTTTKLAPMCEH